MTHASASSPESNAQPLLTRAQIFRLAVPVMLAQAATASTGVVDTLVMGLYGSKADLGAVGVAAVAVNFIYWAFGFLRMSTTGLTAQANGAGNTAEVNAALQRALLTGAVMGSMLLLMSPLLGLVVFDPFDATDSVKTLAGDYWDYRLWGAPAILMGYGITGWLLGNGRTGLLLLFQIILNAVNCGLDLWFVVCLEWGPAGIGAGTAIAEWTALICGLWIVRRGLQGRAEGLFSREKLLQMFSANRDILIRTLALLFAFAWFVNSGAELGTAVLAGNQVLLQFVSVSAFILDGYAFVAEKEIGEAWGSKQRARLIRAMRLTTELALVSGALISLSYFIGGGWLIEHFVSDAEARAAALNFLPYCAVIPLLGVACWQLDGFFIGGTQGKALRNAAVVTTVLYVITDHLFTACWGNSGLWLAFLMMYLYRAFSLGIYLPGFIRRAS